MQVLRRISGLWRLCIVFCLPSAALADWLYTANASLPDLPALVIFQADPEYATKKDLRIVYRWHFGAGERSRPSKWFNSVGGTPASVEGYEPRGCNQWEDPWLCWIQLSQQLTEPQKETAAADAAARHESGMAVYRNAVREYQALNIAITLAPFLFFWLAVGIFRWVRAGF